MKKDFIDIMNALEVHQMILQGPPGTSKTYNAKKIIAEGIFVSNLENNPEDFTGSKEQITEILNENQINSEGEGYWDMVQLHPSYGYEDFVRGITIKTENQQIQYETVNKIFGKMCKIASDSKAKAKGKDKKYFLLIDEINRADVATVFGELIYALEYRDEAIETPYEVEQLSKEKSSMVKSSKITVPDNLYIIGTMNTADKSVGNIDYAIRRRFIFFDLLPDENVIENDAKKVFLGVNEFIKTSINTQYRANDFLIGHTYFLLPEKKKINLEKLIKYRMEYQVLPILREYYIDGIIRLSNNDFLNKYLTGEVELSDEVNDEKDKKDNKKEEKKYVINEIINAFSLGENNGNATEDESGENND